MKRLVTALCLAAAALVLCQDFAFAGPPPWAPAHGRKGQHNYRYYPDQQVYHDPGRNLYFYRERDKWISAPLLPPFIKIPNPAAFVPLDMDILNPFNFHLDVVKLHPPGLPGLSVPVPVPAPVVPVPVPLFGGGGGGGRDGGHDRDHHDDDDRHEGRGKHKGGKHKGRD